MLIISMLVLLIIMFAYYYEEFLQIRRVVVLGPCDSVCYLPLIAGTKSFSS
jgi:hypothetical protein